MNLRFMPIPMLFQTLTAPLSVGAISHEEYWPR